MKCRPDWVCLVENPDGDWLEQLRANNPAEAAKLDAAIERVASSIADSIDEEIISEFIKNG